MRKVAILRCLSLLFATSAIVAYAEDPAAKKAAPPAETAKLLHFDNPKRIQGSYLVFFKKEVQARESMSRASATSKKPTILPDTLPSTPEKVEALSHALAQSINGHVTLIIRGERGKVRGFSVEASEEQIKKLAEDPRVDHITADISIETDSVQNLSTSNNLWHLDRIDQRDLPLNRQYRYDPTAVGSPIQMYVIDTGTRTTHDEFYSISPYVRDCSLSGSNDRCQTYLGYFCDAVHCFDAWENNDIFIPADQDCHGHGTNVSSLVAGQKYGVARGAYIHPVKFTTGCGGGGSLTSLLRALNYVLSEAGSMTVVNLSLGINSVNTDLEAPIYDLLAVGASVVIAAGNNSANACNSSPARMGGSTAAITVGASNIGDQKWSGSNYGSCVNLFAPGENVLGAGIASDTSTQAFDGSSQAAPIVAGVVAIYKDLNPNHDNVVVKSAILAAASTNKLSSIGSGSPNKLAYTLLPGVDTTNLPGELPGSHLTPSQLAMTISIMPYYIM